MYSLNFDRSSRKLQHYSLFLLESFKFSTSQAISWVMFVEQKMFLVPRPNTQTGENSLIPNKSALSINVVHSKADGVPGSVNDI